MEMRALIFLIALSVVVSADECSAQKLSRAELYLDVNKPGVYLTFEKRGPRKPQFSTESDRGVWLRLHNNMKAPIFIYANATLGNASPWVTVDGRQTSFVKDGVEVVACYDVESTPRFSTRVTEDRAIEMNIPVRVPPIEQGPLTSCYWSITASSSRQYGFLSLAPGNSVVFSVPANFVTAGRRIATEISYAWESDSDGYVSTSEPHHRVFFSMDD